MVTPPRHTGGLLQREPLLSRMLKARRLRCMVVRAPAGTGKTSLMTAFQQALTPLGFEVAWLSLSADVDCSAGLLHHLLASFDQIHPTITDQARPWLQGGIAKEAIERTTIGLIQGLSRYEREVTLVMREWLEEELIESTLQREVVLRTAADQAALPLAPGRRVSLGLRRFHTLPTPISSIVLCAEDAPMKKPHPQVYELALQRLAVAPGQAFALEDSPNGLKAARAAGIACGITRSAYFAGETFEGAAWVRGDLDEDPTMTLARLMSESAGTIAVS